MKIHYKREKFMNFSLYHKCIKIIKNNIPNKKSLYELKLPISLLNSIKSCCGETNILNSIKNYHYDCFLYAYNNTTETKINCIIWAITYDNMAVLKYLCEIAFTEWDTFIPACAAKYNRLNILKYVHRHGCPWDTVTMQKAAANGKLDCLAYAHENGCPWDITTTRYAAANGKLDCLAYAHENGCPWDITTTKHAAANGKLDCLAYAHENGCPWAITTTKHAAANGKLDCLVYAHENGCPWDITTTKHAVANGKLDCLVYARENGCHWDITTTRYAAGNGNLEFFFMGFCWMFLVMKICVIILIL